MSAFVKLLASWTIAAAIAAGAEPALLNLVMPDARTVFGVQIDRIKATPLGQMAFKQMQSDAQLQALINTTGFDPSRDLSEILIASPGGSQHPPVLILLRGSFDPERFAWLARTIGGGLTTYQGVPILRGQKRDSGVLALLDNETIAGGDLRAVESAIARRERAGALAPKLAEKLHELRARFDIWGVSLAPIAPLASNVPDSRVQGTLQQNTLQAIEQFSGGVKIGSSLEISAHILTRTGKDASELANGLRFLAGLLQLNQPAARPAMEPIALTVQGRSIKFSVTIPREQLEQAMQQAAARGARKAAVPSAERPTLPTPPRSTALTITSAEGSAVTVPSAKDATVVVLPAPKN